MSWKDQGNKEDNNDPWTGKKKPEEGPPDLEQIFRQFHQKWNKLLGSKASYLKINNMQSLSLGAILIVLILIWFLSGIFIVAPGEQGVVLRFGRYVESVGPGPHWVARFIERVLIVNEQKISNYPYEAEMLTKDTNIVHVKLAVQYRIENAKKALFEVTDVYESLRQATASALRQVIGHTTLDAILTIDREKVRNEVKNVLIQTLAGYKSGILITDVALQEARAPDAVRAAFEDVNKAQEDEKRFINYAQAYGKRVEPIAKGQAQRLLADAEAYRQQVVLKAKGEVAQFLALLPQHKQNPKVLKDRLYLDMMETVLSNVTKVLVDTHNNNLLYLPLDKLMTQPVLEKGDAEMAKTVFPTTSTPVKEPASNTSSIDSVVGYEQKGGGY
ncbi:MAG: Modulator of FtsH protease HflK [Legionellaceae bacterium]